MYRNSRSDNAIHSAEGTSSSEACLFAQAILGNPIPNAASGARIARAERDQLERLAGISDRHRDELRRLQSDEVAARREREQLEWLAQISEEYERELQTLLRDEVAARESQQRHERLIESLEVQEARWDPARHPRRGGPPNAGWFATTGGAGGSSGAGRSPSLLDKIRQRNKEIGKLTGVVTPGMLRANRLANELESAARLSVDVARAAAAGLITGEKAVVNGFATAVKDVATLGLSPGQLELIGVTKEDRERGYDTAVAISTGSGQLLIAVGTGGIASALNKGGSVARAASGALIVYDAAGNGVGVVQGVHDAAKNGITVANGVQVAAGALGLGANIKAAKSLRAPTSANPRKTIVPATNVDDFVGKLPRTSTPTGSAANLYEIKHTGPHNYTVSGGGAKFDIDGYRGSTILEAKHVGNAKSSPYVPGSSCPESVRTEILKGVRDELKRVRTIIESESTPFREIGIVTNSPEAKKFFEELLREAGVPGNVQLKP